ncbi:MAG: hypothetical protein WBR10_11685 [Candidatus Acidiferrum sp.]
MATSTATPAIFAASTEFAAPPSITATPAITHDRRRTWLWAFLAAVAASQLYFVRELLAAFALFAIAFAAIAAVVVTLYMLHKSIEMAIARLAALRHRVIAIPSVAHDNRKVA